MTTFNHYKLAVLVDKGGQLYIIKMGTSCFPCIVIDRQHSFSVECELNNGTVS